MSLNRHFKTYCIRYCSVLSGGMLNRYWLIKKAGRLLSSRVPSALLFCSVEQESLIGKGFSQSKPGTVWSVGTCDALWEEAHTCLHAVRGFTPRWTRHMSPSGAGWGIRLVWSSPRNEADRAATVEVIATYWGRTAESSAGPTPAGKWHFLKNILPRTNYMVSLIHKWIRKCIFHLPRRRDWAYLGMEFNDYHNTHI